MVEEGYLMARHHKKQQCQHHCGYGTDPQYMEVIDESGDKDNTQQKTKHRYAKDVGREYFRFQQR